MATFLHTMVRITDPAIGVDDLDATLGELAAQGIEPERPPYSVREGDHGCASYAIRMES
jgi:hypothetical protein